MQRNQYSGLEKLQPARIEAAEASIGLGLSGTKELRNIHTLLLELVSMATPVRKVPLHLQSAANRLHIKNGVVVNDDGEERVDIYLEVIINHDNSPARGLCSYLVPGRCYQAGGETPHNSWRGKDC